MNKKLKKFVSLSIFLLWLFQAIFSPIGKEDSDPDNPPPQDSSSETIPPSFFRSPDSGNGDKNRD